MPRVLFTVTNDLTYDRRMIRICTTLADAGWEVRLIGVRKRGSEPLRPQRFEQQRLPCIREKGKRFYLEYNLRLLLYLLFSRFDAVCSIDLDTLLPGFLAARLRGKPLIYDAHEYFTEVPEVVRRPGIKKAWEGLADWLVPKVDLAYTVGPELARVLAGQYRVPFGVIRNLPRRVHRSEAPQKAEPPVILYQGALNEARGLEEAIDAMREITGAQLWLAGEGDLSASLRERAREKGVQDRVRFLGYVLPEDLPALTVRATLGFNLLRPNGLSYYYSLANKAFDYIQAGVPALHPDFPEYRALQADFDCSILLQELTPEAIAARINALLGDPGELQRLSDHCRKASEELCWEKEEKELLRMYEKLMG